MAYEKEHIETYAREKTKGRAISGFDHFKRVYQTASKLAREYDKDVLHAACFLHDIEMGDEHHKASAEHAKGVLKGKLPPHKLHAVEHAILHHVLEGKPKSVEAILVHDADLLDYLGIVGMIRLALAAREWYGKEDMSDILRMIKGFRKLIADKLLLKQSRAKAAERLAMMDIAIAELEKEVG